VQFPFGYGLSYTTFDWQLVSVNYPSGSELSKDSTIEIEVWVENTGTTYSGCDTVQLYAHAPYILGEIEKPEVKLCAFAKTGLLKPGEGEKLTLSVSIQDLASYDCYDSNYNGFMGYELDGGEYTLSLRTDAHTVANVSGGAEYKFSIPSDGYKYSEDATTGYTVENRFTTYTNTVSGASSVVNESMVTSSKAYSIDGADSEQNIVYLSRADFASTFPVYVGNRSTNGEFISNVATFSKPVTNSSDVMPITGSNETSYTLEDVAGLSYDDEKWDKLIQQLSVNTLASLCANGGYGTIEIKSIGKPACVDMDGGSGIYPAITGFDEGEAVAYPSATVIAASWNWYLAYQVGQSLAKEALAIGMNGWYAPGANMHRSPFGGRNFEYYSEDSYVAGIMCAYEVKGSIQGGVYAYVKHFVANDSDEGRNGEFRWLTEQALREVYCKPFEIAVKVGGANAIMSSVDRIGATRSASSYQLLTEVLRNEWGFRGSVITDYYQGGNTHDADQNIRSGNDLQLMPEGKTSLFDDLSSATAVIALQKSAKNILYTYINTQYIHATEENLELSNVIGTRTAVYAWWKVVLYVVDGVVIAGCVGWGAAIVVKRRKAGKKAKESEQ
jgi:beta-glucosidase